MKYDEKRTEVITSRVPLSIKEELQLIKKEQDISSGDILINYVENNTNEMGNEFIILKNSLCEQLDRIEKLEKEILKVGNYLKGEHEFVLGKIKKLEKLQDQSTSNVSVTKTDALRNVIRSFISIRDEHTTLRGDVKSDFDSFKVGRTLCGRQGVEYSTFVKALGLIDDGSVSVERFMESDLSEWGLV